MTNNDQWLDASEGDVRSVLKTLTDEILADVLNERELEALHFGYRERVTDVHLSHIKQLPQELPFIFAAAAERARVAGFDGVELHYAHAYTMAGFLSAQNDRSDGYGGSLENRLRLPLEVYRAVRESVGEDYVVGVRFLADEVIEGGSRVDDAAFYAVEFARAGFDFLSLSKAASLKMRISPKLVRRFTRTRAAAVTNACRRCCRMSADLLEEPFHWSQS